MPKPHILYISYDGMLEPLGQSQVLAYLERLAPGYRIHLISFEKKRDWADRRRRDGMRSRIAAYGIAWTPLRYHKSPSGPATAFDILAGSIAALGISLRYRIRLVHARSYVPALMALPVRRLIGAKLLFDMRGFWADERVDGGLWPPGGTLYRAAKSLERRFLRAADHVVTLTNASISEIRSFPYLEGKDLAISLIPTCADLDRFNPRKKTEPREFVLGYVGSVGTWYLFDEVLACFCAIAARDPAARLLIVNRTEHDFIAQRLDAFAISRSRVELVAAEHGDVPAFISRMSAGAAIIKPVYSKMASAPTKLAEYLGCGIPCLGNDRVGDVEEILEGRRVGVVLKEFSSEGRAEAVDRLLRLVADPGTADRCVEAARDLFSIDEGVRRYRSIYEELLAPADVRVREDCGA